MTGRKSTASDVACAGCCAKPPIETQVVARHHVRGEPLLEHTAHCPAVEPIVPRSPNMLALGTGTCIALEESRDKAM
jgi:hypothetical protein